MEALRSEAGCPWDREQTRRSLKTYLIEEAYELVEAIDEEEPEKIKEELGDLLFQIVFHAQIAKERDEFDLGEVIETISEKMVSRHPHVFGDGSLRTVEEVLDRWEEHKRKEGKLGKSILEGIPADLPSLLKAYRVQERVSRVGFDWERVEEVLEKVYSELTELETALTQDDRERIEDELGDVLFTLVNLSRFLGINPEEALRKTTTRFIGRFSRLESRVREEGRDLADCTAEEMNHLWDEVKRAEKKG